jgi:hypothetical protein
MKILRPVVFLLGLLIGAGQAGALSEKSAEIQLEPLSLAIERINLDSEDPAGRKWRTWAFGVQPSSTP